MADLIVEVRVLGIALDNEATHQYTKYVCRYKYAPTHDY